MNIFDVIKRPVKSEKGELIRRENNEYVFEVDRRANKIEIRQAVEKLFDVKVVSVNTLTVKSKNKRFRFSMYKTPIVKKAMVKLKDGDEIAGFEF